MILFFDLNWYFFLNKSSEQINIKKLSISNYYNLNIIFYSSGETTFRTTNVVLESYQISFQTEMIFIIKVQPLLKILLIYLNINICFRIQIVFR